MRSRRLAVAGVLLVIVSSSGCGLQPASYNREVRPILQNNCLSCHSPGGEGYAASGFSVADYDSLMKGTKFGPVIVPGSSVSSTLVILIKHKGDPSINMPRPTRQALAEHEKSLGGWKSPMLAAEEIETIRDWIDAGAKNN